MRVVLVSAAIAVAIVPAPLPVAAAATSSSGVLHPSGPGPTRAAGVLLARHRPRCLHGRLVVMHRGLSGRRPFGVKCRQARVFVSGCAKVIDCANRTIRTTSFVLLHAKNVHNRAAQAGALDEVAGESLGDVVGERLDGFQFPGGELEHEDTIRGRGGQVNTAGAGKYSILEVWQAEGVVHRQSAARSISWKLQVRDERRRDQTPHSL
mmetsp:Transcript_7178/g.18417  ORF Transcript_7178/g.18417 Transcript_7178/m.18417 type:complete len:208 (-) Transcript_7178:587-1210(-)